MLQSESNIQNVLDRLRETGSKIPITPCVYPLKEPIFGRGCSHADTVALEGVVNAALPEDFVLFQRKCGSIEAMDVWNGYSLWGASHIRALIVDSLSQQVMQPFSTFSNTVPIGGDGGGNMFLMAIVGSNHVSKWNHETNAQERLANTFSEFLERMLTDWEHFVVEDSNWNYMAG